MSEPVYPLLTRQKTLTEPTDDGARIREVALALWDAEALEEPVRLIGVSLSGFDNATQQLELSFEARRQVRDPVGPVLDQIQERFGKGAIRRAVAEPDKVTPSLQRKRGGVVGPVGLNLEMGLPRGAVEFIIRRMTKNSPGRFLGAFLVLGATLVSCQGSARREAEEKAFQGVVEFEETTVAFEVGGRVLTRVVSEGDHVESGTVLADLDDELLAELARGAHRGGRERARRSRPGALGLAAEDINAMAARVDAAKATEALVAKNLKREQDLFQKNVVAQAAVDELETELARASAERQSLEQNLLLLKRGAKKEDVELAEARVGAAEAATETDQVKLERHELRAPSSGTVLDTYIEPGEIVAAGTPILSIADTQHPYVDVFVPQAENSRESGSAARPRCRWTRSEPPLSGHVEHVARKAEFTPRFSSASGSARTS